MTYSEFKIIFNEDLKPLDFLFFYLKNRDFPNDSGRIYSQAWQVQRVQSNQVAVGIPTRNPGERSAINYISSFNQDFNLSNTFEVTRTVNEVTIKSRNPEFVFSGAQAFSYGIGGNVPKNLEFQYNDYDSEIFSIESVVNSAATDPCNKVKFTITTSVDIDRVVQPQNITGYNSNIYQYEALRGTGRNGTRFNFEAIAADGQRVFKTLAIPNRLSAGNIEQTINNSPEGATVIIIVRDTYFLNLQYSLDGTTWRTSNVFTGVLSGNRTIYVKDQFGCQAQKDFVVEAFGVGDPFFYISKSNSLRFVNVSDDADKKIDENRFSYEDNVLSCYKQHYCFTKDNEVTIQFKTNYQNIRVFTASRAFNLIKQSNNLGLKDSRDAFSFDYNGQTGIYFVSGNRYDYDTGVISGEYTLNGALPEWAKIDGYIKINNAWHQIQRILPVEDKQADVIIIDTPFVSEIIKVGSVYFRENYDVYEFDVKMSDFLNSEFTIDIECTSSNYPTKKYKSEAILVKEQLSATEIIYSNDTNTDVFYSTGIEHLLNIQLDDISDKPIGELENHKTDTRTILLNGNVQESKEIQTAPITRAMMIQFYRALFHRALYLDSVRYVLSEIPEVEGRLDQSNLYVVKAKLIKESDVYNSRSSSTGTPIVGGLIELPALITTDLGNYVKI